MKSSLCDCKLVCMLLNNNHHVCIKNYLTEKVILNDVWPVCDLGCKHGKIE